MAAGWSANPVTNRSMLSLVTLGPMKHATPTALETAPSLEPNPLERPPHGPSDIRTSRPQPPSTPGLDLVAGVAGRWRGSAIGNGPSSRPFCPAATATSQGTAKRRPGPARRGRRHVASGGGASDERQHQGFRYWSGRGDAHLHRHRELPRDRTADEGPVQRGADRSSRRFAGGDRSAAL